MLGDLSASAACAQVYRDDDTILSWDLINEPRCERIGCDTDMLAWIEDMAPYVKALDSNHLLTVGALPDAMVRKWTPATWHKEQQCRAIVLRATWIRRPCLLGPCACACL